MFPVYRNMQNSLALKSLLKAPEIPAENLAIGEDEYHADVPLLIFTEQHLPAQRPMVVSPYSLPYEKTAAKGAGDTLSMEDFPTTNFDLGNPFESL